jgi:hypothetical protein
MNNRILHIELRDRSVVPAEAEVLVTVVPETLDGGTSVQGRLMGPRCRYASTIEVAYHLRPLLVPTARPAITMRAIIPEASLWDPESPHLYVGPVELLQNGERCQVVEVRHGLRHISVGPRGMRINGRLLRLKGKVAETITEEEALASRQAGYNLFVAPMRESSRMLWEVADRIGFLVLGQLSSDYSPALMADLAGHPSCMGWIVPAGVPIPGEIPYGTLLGAEREEPRASFVVVSASTFAQSDLSRPALVVGATPEQASQFLQGERVIVGVVC